MIMFANGVIALGKWFAEHWFDIVLVLLVLWFLHAQRQLVINFNNCPQAGKPDIRQTYKI